MDKIQYLKKFAPKIKVKKLSIYQQIKKYDYLIKKYHIPVNLQDEIALENTIAYIHSYLNKERIDEIYSEIEANPFINDVLDFTSLNKVIELEILENIGIMPHFYNPDLIIIPVFDQKLNYEFVYDYLRTNLKWEKTIWKQELTKFKNPIDEYGFYFYHFTDFKYINHYGDYYYFYLEDTKRIYIFNNTTKEFVDDFAICDTKYKGDTLGINTLIEIVEYYANQQIDELITYLYEQGLICEKVFKKMNKK